MRTPAFLRSCAFIVGLMLFSACAVGTPPPEETPMVTIDTGLTFLYGPDGPCIGDDDDSFDPCAQDILLLQSEQTAPAVYVQLGAFQIDAHEVTNIQFEYCERMGACPNHNIINAVSSEQQDYHGNEAFDHHPVVQVTFEQAEKYCAFVGKRLPTEVEWERVARGNPSFDNRRYPAEGMGTNPIACIDLDLPTKFCGNENLERSPTAAELDSGGGSNDYVLERSAGGKEARIYHLFGNAAEWTSSFYDKNDTPTCANLTPPCDACSACDDLADGPEKDTCNAECVECPACPTSDASCFYLCRDEPAMTISCQPAQSSEGSPLPMSAVVTTSSSKRVVRGGSVFDGSKTVCRFRSSGRDRAASDNVAPDRHLAYVGFRCAKDL